MGLKRYARKSNSLAVLRCQKQNQRLFRRHKTFIKKVVTDFKYHHEHSEENDVDLSIENITDSQLQMIFAICNPAIPSEAQIGLRIKNSLRLRN